MNEVVIQIQSVVYNNSVDSIFRSLTSLKTSVSFLIASQPNLKVIIKYGDASEKPRLNRKLVTEARILFGSEIDFNYVLFGGNLGSAAGHNKLAEDVSADYLLTLNPDVVIFPNAIDELYKAMAITHAGMAEAKQIPIEHPKEFDTNTGETSWASTAFCMIKFEDFRKCQGFDSESFFLYCDDVDLSWRIKLNNSKVIFVPSSLVYHDKKLSSRGEWIPSKAEIYYSAQAALMMAYKWRNNKMLMKVMAQYRKSRNPIQIEVLNDFCRKAVGGKLTKRIKASRKVAKFHGYNFAEHRFKL